MVTCAQSRDPNLAPPHPPPPSSPASLRAVARDIAEGADFVMVKPGGGFLDVCRDVADASSVPVAAYQVSGEYAMLAAAAAAGAFDLKRAVRESLASFRRAGASIVITYFAPDILQWATDDARAALERADAGGAARAGAGEADAAA